MRHIKQYEEIEWSKLNPLNLIKSGNLSQISSMINNISAENSEVSSKVEDDKVIVEVKVNNGRLEDVDTLIRITLKYDRKLSFYINKTEYEFLFKKSVPYYIEDSYMRTEFGILGVSEKTIKVENHKEIILSTSKLENDIKDRIIDYVRNVNTIFSKSINNIKENNDLKRREEENIKKQKELLLDKDDIVECFGDLIDLSDEHEITSNNSIIIEFIVHGIKINEQRKSKSHYGKYGSTSFTFDEAHIDINDTFVEVSSALINAKSRLKSISNDIEVRSIFKNDIVIIEVYVPDERQNTRSSGRGTRAIGPF